MSRLKVGVLETGAPPRDLQPRFGRYSAMFAHLLGEDAFAWSTFNVRAGEFPDRPDDCDAYLVTGSAAGVYDPDPWIGQSMEFLRSAKGKAALVGVCFGHQLMAQAFGGQVIKSPKGWGIGLHTYRVTDRRDWMDDADAVTVAASHQDQVVHAPPGAAVVAASDFTPFAMLAYGDQPAISVQPHPEFEAPYAAALIEARRGTLYAPDQADRALASLAGPSDRQKVGDWIGAFLRTRRAA